MINFQDILTTEFAEDSDLDDMFKLVYATWFPVVDSSFHHPNHHVL